MFNHLFSANFPTIVACAQRFKKLRMSFRQTSIAQNASTDSQRGSVPQGLSTAFLFNSPVIHFSLLILIPILIFFCWEYIVKSLYVSRLVSNGKELFVYAPSFIEDIEILFGGNVDSFTRRNFQFTSYREIFGVVYVAFIFSLSYFLNSVLRKVLLQRRRFAFWGLTIAVSAMGISIPFLWVVLTNFLDIFGGIGP